MKKNWVRFPVLIGRQKDQARKKALHVGFKEWELERVEFDIQEGKVGSFREVRVRR